MLVMGLKVNENVLVKMNEEVLTVRVLIYYLGLMQVDRISKFYHTCAFFCTFLGFLGLNFFTKTVLLCLLSMM